MGMAKCPDCGKLVSDRASACPACGCPSAYFVTDESITTEDTSKHAENSSAEQAESSSAKQEEPSSAEEKKTSHPDEGKTAAMTVKEQTPVEEKSGKHEVVFNFNGLKAPIPEEVRGIAGQLGYFLQNEKDAEAEFERLYTNAKGLQPVMERYYEMADDRIFAMVDKACAILYSYDVYMSSSDFLGKYQKPYRLDVVAETKEIYDQYCNIVQISEEQKLVRQEIKDSRIKADRYEFQGGFIQSSLKAAAMNTAAGMFHAVGDAGRAASDNAQIQDALNRIYKDPETKYMLGNSYTRAVRNVYIAAFRELKARGKLGQGYEINPPAAAKRYLLTKKNETDEMKKLENMVLCVYQDPTDLNYIKEISLAMVSGENNFEDWIDFWGLNSILSGFGQRKEEYRHFVQFLKKNGFEDLFDITNPESEAEVDELSEQEQSLNSELQEQMESMSLELQEQIQNLELQLQENKEMLDTLTMQLEDLTAAIVSLESEEDASEEVLSELKTQQELVEKSIASQEEMLATINETIESLQAQLEVLAEE